MELQLEADQELLLETTRRFIATEAPLSEVRRLHDDPIGFDRAYWKRGAELGWTAMLVPEALGGGSVSGAGLLDLNLVAEEFGRTVAPGPLLPVNIVASALARSGGARHQAEVLPALVSGDAIATWAFAETSATWDAPGVQLRATKSDRGYALDGTKSFVQDATVADWLLVTARGADGLSQFLVARDTPGIEIEPLVSLDMTRRYGAAHFRGVEVDDSATIGTPGGADDDVEHQLQIALVLQNAETVGATNQMFDLALAYANDRMSFGRPIGSYQAIKHRLADMKLWLEACLGTSSASAKAVQTGGREAGEVVRVSKAYIADRCPAIGQDCVQIHGGIGVTWESDLHLYLRRIAQNAALYGSVRQLRAQLAAMLGVGSASPS